jgi:hypothetical protein
MWESENQDESPLMTTDNFHGIDRLVDDNDAMVTARPRPSPNRDFTFLRHL